MFQFGIKYKIMKFKFENLIIWQKAMDLGEDMNKLSYKFSKEEVYNLSSQIRRASDSIALNYESLIGILLGVIFSFLFTE